MEVTRYVNQEKIVGDLPPIQIQNPTVVEILATLLPEINEKTQKEDP